MKILTAQSSILQALPSHYKFIYPGVEVVALENTGVTIGKKTMVVSQNLTPQQLVDKLLMDALSNIIQFNPEYFLSDLERTALLLDKPDIYFIGQAESLVKNPLKTTIFEFNSPSEKENMKPALDDFNSGITDTKIKESVVAIASELFTNAVWDAPREAKEKWREEHPYLRGEKAKLTLVHTEDRIAISCSDPYGSLKPKKFLEKLKTVFLKGEPTSDDTQYSCLKIYNNCDTLLLGAIPERLSVVACLLPVSQLNAMTKSIHVVST